MSTGSLQLLTMRGALGATEGASTTPLRLLYPGVAENVDTSGLQRFATIEDRVAWAKADGLRNIYAGIEDNTLTLSNVPVSYQDIGWWLCTIPGIQSGAGAGAGTPTTTDTSAYTRAFLVSQVSTVCGAAGGYDAFIEVAQNDLIGLVGMSIPGLRCTDMTLTFNKRASGTDTGVLMSGTWQSPGVCTHITAFTGTLTDRAQTFALGNSTKSYIDPSTAGSTADTNLTTAVWHWSRTPAWHDGFDGNANHTSMHFPGNQNTELTITRKFSDKLELAAYISKGLRKVNILNEGAVVGAATAKNTLKLEFIGKVDDHTPLHQDGILYATVHYVGMYDATLLSSWQITLINAVSTAYTAL